LFDGFCGCGHIGNQLPVTSCQRTKAPHAGRWQLETGNYTLKDVPQPQLLLAFGLLKMNPLLTRPVS